MFLKEPMLVFFNFFSWFLRLDTKTTEDLKDWLRLPFRISLLKNCNIHWLTWRTDFLHMITLLCLLFIYKSFLCEKKRHTLEKSLTQFKNQRITPGQDSKDVVVLGFFFPSFLKSCYYVQNRSCLKSWARCKFRGNASAGWDTPDQCCHEFDTFPLSLLRKQKAEAKWEETKEEAEEIKL